MAAHGLVKPRPLESVARGGGKKNLLATKEKRNPLDRVLTSSKCKAAKLLWPKVGAKSDAIAASPREREEKRVCSNLHRTSSENPVSIQGD